MRSPSAFSFSRKSTMIFVFFEILFWRGTKKGMNVTPSSIWDRRNNRRHEAKDVKRA